MYRKWYYFSESFKTIPHCPDSHNFYFHSQPGSYQRAFLSAVRKDIKLISNSLPKGIWVRAFEDRMVRYNVDILNNRIENNPTQHMFFTLTNADIAIYLRHFGYHFDLNCVYLRSAHNFICSESWNQSDYVGNVFKTTCLHIFCT